VTHKTFTRKVAPKKAAARKVAVKKPVGGSVALVQAAPVAIDAIKATTHRLIIITTFR
jgi:hypothetical protein